MQKLTINQYEMIRETEPGQFENKLNEAMKRLANQKPTATVDIDGDSLDALITFEEQIFVGQPVVEEIGVTFVCEECPYFKPTTKRDGSPDFRSKWGDCPHTEMHRTMKTAKACDILYRKIKNGDVRLALKEEGEGDASVNS